MARGAQSAITLAVLGLLLVLAAAWGWNAATEPLPAKVDTPLCVSREIAAGQKVFPPDVTVSVYNAGTRDGLAGRVMQGLTDDGFAEGNSGNTASRARDAAVEIWTEQPKSPAVRLVASRFGKKVDIQRREGIGAGVTVVVGDDFGKLAKGDKFVVVRDDTEICSPPV